MSINLLSKSTSTPSRSLRTKLTIIFLVMGMVPMVGLGVLSYNCCYNALYERAGNQMKASAADLAAVIDRNLFERYGDVQAFAFNPMAQESPKKSLKLSIITCLPTDAMT